MALVCGLSVGKLVGFALSTLLSLRHWPRLSNIWASVPERKKNNLTIFSSISETMHVAFSGALL